MPSIVSGPITVCVDIETIEGKPAYFVHVDCNNDSPMRVSVNGEEVFC